MKLGIIDYGAGNLGSVRNAFGVLGQKAELVSDPSKLKDYDKVLLPGVGAFGEVCEQITQHGFDQAIREYARSGRYLLGICLGMQLLFEKSYEFGEHAGLGLLQGEIVRFANAPRVPHMGWDRCVFTDSGARHGLLAGLSSGVFLYFVHSYHVRLQDSGRASAQDSGWASGKPCVHIPESVLGVCEYGECFPAIVGRDNVLGLQPHPEKSHEAGLRILANFLAL